MTDPVRRQPALELVGLQKNFGPVAAVRDVSMTVEAGSIHGVVGENGAGKSTLMNLVYGFHPADRGTIRVDGVERRIDGPADAIAAGIGMVHQHYLLVGPMTVLENLVLGFVGAGRLDRAERDASARARALMDETGFELDLAARIEDLPIAARQQVEILKALDRGARILILDEPTSVLTPFERQRLFATLRRLREAGRTVILITHKLDEIIALTDRVTILRRGSVVDTVATDAIDATGLAERMVGRKVLFRVDKRAAQPGETLLSVEKLTQPGAFEELSFTIRSGEIVGIAGVVGSGQSQLLQALAGMHPARGMLVWRGELFDAATLTPVRAREMGIAHVPEDRQRHGLVGDFTAAESALLGHQHDRALRNGPLLSRRRIDAACADKMRRYDVRPPDPAWRTRGFSGGNQQKLVLARELDTSPALLLIGEPTRGVDVGAIEHIDRALIELRDRGGAVLLVSSDLDQIVALSDRILVMSGGRITGTLQPEEASEERLGLLMGGIADTNLRAA